MANTHEYIAAQLVQIDSKIDKLTKIDGGAF